MLTTWEVVTDEAGMREQWLTKYLTYDILVDFDKETGIVTWTASHSTAFSMSGTCAVGSTIYEAFTAALDVIKADQFSLHLLDVD